MPIPLVMAAAYGSVLLVGLTIHTIQNMPDGTFRPGTRTPLQPAPSLPQEFESALDNSDTVDPLTNAIEPTTNIESASRQITDLQNAMAAEATTTCEDCPICGFLAGSKANASFPFLPAMDYQHRVSTMMGGGQPLLQFWPAMPRIEEWALADPSSGTGRRQFDGFNMVLCFLIEAKMGYGGYLESGSVYLPNPSGGTILSLAPLADATSTARMAAIILQMQRHNVLALTYPARSYDRFRHQVYWFCSNQKLAIFCYGTKIANAMTRVHTNYLPVGLLPASIWR